MKKIFAIILFLIAFKVQAQQPTSTQVFSDTAQMSNYAGSYAYGVVIDTTDGGAMAGTYSKQISSETIDNIRIFRAASTSYRWFKIANFDIGIQDSGYIKYSDSTTVFATPTQVKQTVSDSTYWRLTSTSLYPKSTSYNVGIGTASPLYKFHVINGGQMYFDGTRMNIATQTANNKLIGLNAGISISGSNNIAFGDFANEFGGSNNISIGNSALDDIGGSNSVAVGNNTGWHNPGDNNTSIGHAANTNSYGGQNIAIGTNTSAAKSIVTSTLNTSVIVTSSATISGATVATFITATGYSVGDTAVFNMVWNGGIPAPYITPSLNKKGKITSSNTIQFLNATSFTTQGSGTFDIVAFNKQNNAIAIGYSTNTDSTNQIVIGNTNNTLLKSNKFVVDLATTPTNGQVLTWSTDRYVPAAGGGGGGNTNSNIGAGYRLAVPNTNNIKTLFAGTGITMDSVSNANGITLNAVAAGIADSFNYYNVKAFGVTGDGVTDDYAAANTANDYVASQGGGVLWWPAGTYITSKPIYRLAGVHWYGVQDQSIIKNTNPTISTFASQACQFMGNYSPSDYDTTVARYFVGHMGTYSNKMAIVDSISKFAVGDVVFIASLGGWPTNDGHFKFYVSRFNTIDSIYSDTVVFKYQLDTIMATARITISGHFISLPHNDAYGHARYMLKNCSTKNMSFQSFGNWMLGEAALNCYMENINVRAAELLSTNGLAFCTIKNIYGNWWKQVIEFAIGCHNTTVDGVNAQYINGNYLVDGSQPLIKFGEQCYDMTIRNAYVNTGNWNSRCIWFGASDQGLIDNIEIHGQNIDKQFLDFSNTDADTSLSSYVTNNRVMNSKFYNNGSLQYYVNMMKPAIPGARLENNSIINCTFQGTVSGSHAILLDGVSPLVSNSDIGSGVVAFGDSLTNGIVQDTKVGNPTVYSANANFKNVYNSTSTVVASKGVSFTEGANGRVGQTTLIAGTKAITIAGLTTSSKAFPGFVTNGGTVTTTWQYKFVCTANTLTITAVDNTGTINTLDTSTLNYFVLN